MIDPQGVCIAFDDPTLEPAPDWTRLDTGHTATGTLVASYTIDRGRQFELDQTDTGRATVQINDFDGTLDPTNPSGPYFGKLEPLLQAAIALYNPVTATWTTIYRGYIEDFDYTIDPSQQYQQLVLTLVDAFEILGAIHMQPGQFGDPPPAGSEGQVFFDNAQVDDRILQILTNAGWPVADLAHVFTGNVDLYETTYSPGETALTALQEAADAEFPGVSNLYVDKVGAVTFHGRLAKFSPADVAAEHGVDWDWHHWKAGDGAAVDVSPTDTAHIRELAFNRGLSQVRNQALATPLNIAPTDIEAQLYSDPTSIGLFGIRSWSAPDLLTKRCTIDDADALTETKRFSEYIVENYKAASNRISQLSFRTMRTEDTRAAATWLLLCEAEISDQVDVTESSPGGGGFNADEFFIEGIHYDVRPLNGVYADVTLSLDVSPAANYVDNPFPAPA